MWNSVMVDDGQWLYSRTSPPLPLDDEETPAYRSWDFQSHQQTNYADWSNKQDGQDDVTEDLFQRDSHSYPTAAQLFRNFVGDESADRMEFYINHLTMEGCDANNISAALADNETSVDESANAYRPVFPLLETIAEETMEELMLDMSETSSSSAAEGSDSPTSNSGRWGWGWGWLNTSDDDSSSVIHVPLDGGSATAITSGSPTDQYQPDDFISEMYRHDDPDTELDASNEDVDEDGESSERDHEVPKKKRKIGTSFDDDDDDGSTCSRSPSVTDSLIQFEALEKELGDEDMPFIFRTSATTQPFEDDDEDDSNDVALSPEVDPEVFLDCLEDCHNSADKKKSSKLAAPESSSGRRSQSGLEDFQGMVAPIEAAAQHSATCGSYTPPRSWSSCPSLLSGFQHRSQENKAQQQDEHDFSLHRRSRSACDVNDKHHHHSHEPTIETSALTCQGQQKPSPAWIVTFDPATEEVGNERERGVVLHDDEDDDDTHWEPDGFLNSDIEEYDTTGSNSDDEDYSTERGDRFDEFGMAFITSRSQRMRSFRSYGDSLNLLDTNEEGALSNSVSSSSSSSRSSPDRCSPEGDQRHPPSSRSRHSVEALSEDSGYGDASGSLPIQRSHSIETRATGEERLLAGPSTPPPPTKESHTLQLPSLTICPPDGSPPSRQWLPEMVQSRGVLLEQQEEHWNGQVSTTETDGRRDGTKEIVSALLLRRQPRSRPAPLSLKEAEEFLIGGDGAAEVGDGPSSSSRCGLEQAEGICIDLESKMSHTLNGNAASDAALTLTTNDDILLHRATDLEPSKINPQIGMRDVDDDRRRRRDDGGWEVPDCASVAAMGEAAKTATDHILAPQKEEDKKEEVSQRKKLGEEDSLHSTDGSDFIQPPPIQASLPDASQHNCSSLDHNVTCSTSISDAMDSAFYPAPVVLKRYGPRQEVEVYISQQQLPSDGSSSSTSQLSPSSVASSIRGVHFSPVVSAVNWRESYLNQSSEEEEDDEHRSDNECSSSTNSSPDRMLQHSGEGGNCGTSGTETSSPGSSGTQPVPQVSPSVGQRVQPSPAVAQQPERSSDVAESAREDSGRNGSHGNSSCPTTIHSATTAESDNHQSKKSSNSTTTLFQRFSLSRLSARMSATFGRSESKRESVKKADGPVPMTESVNKNVAQVEATAASVSKSNGKEKKSKNKTSESSNNSKKMDDFKVVKEPKKRFFSRSPFQRSSSTPPRATPPVVNQAESFERRAAAAAVSCSNANSSSSESRNNVDLSSSGMQRRSDQESVTKQPTSTTLDDVTAAGAIKAGGSDDSAIDDSRTLVVISSSSHPGGIEGSDKSSQGPTPPARSHPKHHHHHLQASHAKPPLPPQTKPRHLHARKNYLGPEPSQQLQQSSPPPPVPMVSSAGLQLALQHFKETARMERERLANSVPDLVAPSTPTPTTRPTSDCIDPTPGTTTFVVSDSSAPALPPLPPSAHRPSTTIIFAGSRERARQAALSRASSVESAWNATASRAALNLSRRNIASSCNNNNGQEGGHFSPSAGSDGPIQGHGPTKSRPVVPGLLETNLDCVQPTVHNNNQQQQQFCYNNNNGRTTSSDETNLDELIQNLQLFCTTNRRDVDYSTQPLSVESASATTTSADKRFKSMLNLGSSSAPVSVQPDIDMLSEASSSVRVPETSNRAKSMEFLLDEDNKSAVHVPENQLKKCGERKMSEHELRIQRSLQKLNVPEWYKKNARGTITTTDGSPANITSNGSSSVTSTGLLRRRDYGGSVSSRHGGWGGLSASNRDAGTASSMTSLGSTLSRAGTPTRVVIPTRVRPDWRNIKSSRESLTSPSAADTSCQSPSWNGHGSSLTSGRGEQPFPRWGSGRSSYSACPSPAPSTSSSASTYRTSSLLNQHGRAPYLGWRSQERLNSSPAPLSIYQSPAERLASTLLAKTTASPTTTTTNSDDRTGPTSPTSKTLTPNKLEDDEGVRSSIRQVTSAIVHYVSESSDGDQPPSSPGSRNGFSRSPERHPLEALSRSPSPRRQRCVWVESSFVGGPMDSPTTSTSSSRHRPTGAASPVRPESPPSINNVHHHHRSGAATSTTTNGGRPVVPSGLRDDRTVTGPLSAVDRDEALQPAKSTLPPATLDDVLKSLLGLAPPSVPLRRPVSQPTIHNKQADRHQQRQQEQQKQQQQPFDQQQMQTNTIATPPVFQEARSFNDLRTYTNSVQVKK